MWTTLGWVGTTLVIYNSYLSAGSWCGPHLAGWRLRWLFIILIYRRVAGVDHIGLGGDYAGIDITPVDLPDVSAYPKVKPEMLIPLTKD